MPQARWYALYVKSRSEKKVLKLLEQEGYKVYLPLTKTLRQWSDRKKIVEIPLFSSYIFANLTNDFYHILQVDGIVAFVKFEGKPAPIPDEQIESLQKLLLASVLFEVTTEKFACGQKVEVTKGIMKGFKGTLVNYKGKQKALLSLDAIGQSLIIEIHPSMLKKVLEEE